MSVGMLEGFYKNTKISVEIFKKKSYVKLVMEFFLWISGEMSQ